MVVMAVRCKRLEPLNCTLQRESRGPMLLCLLSTKNTHAGNSQQQGQSLMLESSRRVKDCNVFSLLTLLIFLYL